MKWPFIKHILKCRIYCEVLITVHFYMVSALQAAIRKELNEFKSREMEVHEDSKQFTRYSNSFAVTNHDAILHFISYLSLLQPALFGQYYISLLKLFS